MVFIPDSDYEGDGQTRAIIPLKQLYAAILLRAIYDIEFPPPPPPLSPTRQNRKKYNRVVLPLCVRSTAMAWIFNEKDMKDKPIVSFSRCCEVLDVEPVEIQKYCARIVLRNKTPRNGDKTIAGGELHVDTRVFKLF